MRPNEEPNSAQCENENIQKMGKIYSSQPASLKCSFFNSLIAHSFAKQNFQSPCCKEKSELGKKIDYLARFRIDFMHLALSKIRVHGVVHALSSL